MKIDIPDYLAFPMLGMLAAVVDNEKAALETLKGRRNLNLAMKAKLFEEARSAHDSASILYETIEEAIKAYGAKPEKAPWEAPTDDPTDDPK